MKRFISFLIVGVLATLLSINEVFALPPSTQASNVTFTTLANGKLRVIATKGNGTHRAIAIEQGATVTGLPSGTYTGDADYSIAPDIDGAGAGLARIVYFGTDRRVDIENLTPGTQYTVKVFEYNVDGYNVADATNNPRSYTTLPAAPALTAATAITSSGFTINWNDPAGTWDGFEITVGLTSNFSSFVSGWNPYSVGAAENSQAFAGNTNTTYFYRIRSKLGSARSAWYTAETSVTTYPVTATLAEASGAVCLGNSYYLTPTGPTPGDGTNDHKFKVYDSGDNLVNLGGFAYTVIPLTPLSVGTYTYTVATVSNKTGEETPERTTFILYVNEPGTTAVVGDIADICALGTYTLTLTGNQPVNGEGTWTYLGPEGAIIADANLFNSEVELVDYGVYTFTWTITSEGCNTTSDEVTFNYYATPDLADAGDDDYNCGLTGMLEGNDPVNGEGTWTYSGPGTVTITDDNLYNSEFTASTHGIYTFTWTIANGTCTPSADEVVITIDQAPTTAAAGEDDGICVPTGTTTITYTLAATPVTVGSGEWTAAVGVTFDDETSPNAVVTVPDVGTYTLTWTTYSPYYEVENESSCQPSSSEVVLVFSPAIDQAEINETTVLESIECGDLDVQLIANDPAVGNGLWTVSGPEGATYELFFEDFSDAIFVTDTYGTYTLTWTISDPNGVCEDTYEAITFELAPVPDPAIIPNKTEVNFACGKTTTLVAQEVNVGIGTWTVNEETAPEGAQFSFTTNINANTVTFVTDTYGAYDFTWTVVGCTPNNSDNITVTFYNSMAGWTAGADQTACLGVDLPMTGATNPSVYTDGIGNPAPNGEWIKVSGPFGVVNFTPDRFTYNASALFPATGTYVLEWRGYNGPCVVSDTKTVVVVEPEVVTFDDLQFSYCNNESNLTASLSATPTGGTFSGSGVSGDIFSPFGLNAGTYTLTYTYNQPAGCTLYDYASVVVTAPTVITWTNTYELCENEGINLTEASPSGGVYSGVGIMEIEGQYGIYPTGPGTYTITYSYENVDGCTSVAENTYVVYPLPVVSFDPETPTIVCENSGVIDFTEYVSPMGEATCADGDILQLINDAEVYAFTVYDGITLSDQNCGTFDPDFEGPGTYTITYYYRDVNTCINVATHVIEVQATPDVYFNIGNEEYCVNDDTNVDLMTYISNYDLCTGGTWTFGGPGVTSSTFNPSLTGVEGSGLVTITYTYECGACTVDGYAEVYVEVPEVIEFGQPIFICNNANPTPLNSYATPTGGIFEAAAGVVMTSGEPDTYEFDPSLVQPGIHTITYTYFTTNCEVSSTFEIEVYALPVVEFVEAPTIVCGNTDYFSFETYVSPEPNCNLGHQQDQGPQGMGYFEFSDEFGGYCGDFDPSQVGYGTYTVTYTYTNENGCTDFATHEFEVVAPPTVSFGTEVTPTYCTTESEGIDLTFFVYPEGGTFSGSGVQADFFTPSSVGVAGTYTLTYTVTDQLTGCTNFDEMEFVLVAPTPITWTNTYEVCANGSVIELSGDALPVGGTYSGTNVSDGNFDPTGLSVGQYTITYTYDNGYCETTATKIVYVRQNPDISWPDYPNNNTFCVQSTSVDIRNATPSGGSFTIIPNLGLEITGNPFDPSAVGVGTYTLTYTYINVFGCVDVETKVISIIDEPTSVAFSNPSGSYCNDDESGYSLTSLASPAGGTFAGLGVEGTTFSPFGLPAGTHTLTYTLVHTCGTYFDTAEFIVVAPATIVWELSTATVCATETSFDIGGATPTGGTYNGGSISLEGTTFNPSTAGVGLHVFTYTYVDGPCESVATLEVEVVPAPVVTWTQTFADYYCANDNSGIALTGAPANGQYTVEPSTNALSAGTFTPSMAEAGTYTITYTVTIGSCSDYATKTIVVAPLPEVSAGVYENVCITASSFTLTAGTPEGGNYSGNGVLSNVFNPASAGVGIHTLTYTYQDPVTLCYNSATTTIQVDEQPVISWTATYGPYCESDESMYQFNAQASIGTGEYSGPGVDGGYFSPSLVGAGTYTVTYTVTNGTCMAYETKTIVVDEQPVIFWTATYGPYCESDESSYELTASHTVGFGEYLGAGVSGGYFYPSEAGPGTHVITYTVTNGTCSAYATKTIVVDEQPVISWTATYGPYCESDESIYQFNAQASIGTGEYTGTGVSGGYFSPSVAGAGTYTVTYTVTNGTCMAYETKTIVVDEQPVISWTATYGPYCIDDTDGYTLGASATVGIGEYSGNGGVSGGTFTPSIAGVGTHTITYTVTNGTCSVYETKTIVVNPLPTVSAGTYAAVCQNTATFTLTAGTPSGGTYSGNGVVSNTFNPASAGVGVHTLTYVYTDEATGCTNSATTTITVNALITANAGADDDAEPNELTFTLNANVPTPGTGLWTVVSSPANSNVNFTDATLYNTFVEVDKSGDYTFRWTITNGACSSFDDVVISFDAGAVPTKLAFNFIPTQVSGQTFSLNVRVLDQNDNMINTPNAVTFTVTVYEGDATFSSTVTGVIAANTSNKSVSVTLNADNPNVGAADIQLLATDDANLLEDGFSNWFNLVATIPTTQATSLAIVRGSTSFDLSWLRGNGDGVIVLAQKSAFTVANNQPQQGISYNNESNYGVAGNLVTTGIYATYSGTGTSFTLGNLQNDGVRYAVKVMEYKSSGVLRSYNRTNAASNSNNRSSTTLKGGVNEELPFVGENILSSSFITPNPARDYISLTVDLTQEAELRIAVYTADGKEVLLPVNNLNYNSGRHNFNIPLKGLAAGVYSVVITTGNELIMDNVVVMP